MAPATEEQESFIRTIALELRVYEPMHLSKPEASRWISDHIEQYNQVDVKGESYYDVIGD